MMNEEKKEEFMKKIKDLYKESNLQEKERLQIIFKEIMEDPYYKENMLYYFKQFLVDRY